MIADGGRSGDYSEGSREKSKTSSTQVHVTILHRIK